MYLPKLENLGITRLSKEKSQAPQELYLMKRASLAAWGPGVISNVVFGTIMVFIGVATLWQGYYSWKINHRRGTEVVIIIRSPEGFC